MINKLKQEINDLKTELDNLILSKIKGLTFIPDIDPESGTISLYNKYSGIKLNKDYVINLDYCTICYWKCDINMSSISLKQSLEYVVDKLGIHIKTDMSYDYSNEIETYEQLTNDYKYLQYITEGDFPL